MQILNDRKEAGRELAKQLALRKCKNPIVLGMPRGGVVVAYEIARQLHAPLDVVVARKIGAPDQPELAIGAIAPHNTVVLNEGLIASFRLSQEEVQQLIAKEKIEMERRLQLYRQNQSFPDVKNNTVIVVDDGLATGLTALAAVRFLHKLKPKKLILAVGACASDSAEKLQHEVDELICLLIPEHFYAVGEWYHDFSQTTDEEVLSLLAMSRQSKH